MATTEVTCSLFWFRKSISELQQVVPFSSNVTRKTIIQLPTAQPQLRLLEFLVASILSVLTQAR
eukprot:1258213-Amphidinium_carterae.2